LRSEAHEVLYRRLLDIAASARTAVDEADPETLENLAREQRSVMEELGRIGLSPDAALLDLVREVKNQIQAVLSEIKDRRRVIGEKLELQMGKRKQITAYRQVRKGCYR
jgi:hypothetical protein